MWVVKLGGSFARSDELPRWLAVAAAAGAGKIVLVPGGGPWADEVRAAQKRERFDDRVAHGMALRAMERYGHLLCSMQAGLVPACTAPEIHAVLERGQVPVWMPYEMALADPSIPQSWNVTSDSLAAWLARQMDASALLLVKSVAISTTKLSLPALTDRGWVDAAFGDFVAGARYAVCLLGRGRQDRLARMLCDPAAIPPAPDDAHLPGIAVI
ncbi:MAG TPA: aspartate kinase [Burkholderiales bacterium]|nr:aspartate kinase [Burkholderiales bacterium]